MNRYFAPGGEFSLIENLFDASHFAKDGTGLGDDGYLLKLGGETWAVSTDTSVEGVHFRLDWAPPGTALAKALLSNLSDLNAMGGTASLAFFNLGALKAWNEADLQALGEVLARMESRFGFRIVGGDTVRKDKESFFTFTVMGRVSGHPLLRSNARPGHRVYVSGRLGGSAAGLELFRAGFRTGSDTVLDPFLTAHLLPVPPLTLGPVLAACARPAAAIDISDGLSSELAHLSRQSGCRLTVEWGKLPYDSALERLPGGEGWRDRVLHGGEEYQLLFTGEFTDAELEKMRAVAEISEIGAVAAGEGVGIVDGTGAESELMAQGWSH
jgi:thiamine-monophosphate kinase